MIKKTSGALLYLLLVLSTLVVHGANAQQATVFINVNVIPFDRERVLAAQTVIIRDGGRQLHA